MQKPYLFLIGLVAGTPLVLTSIALRKTGEHRVRLCPPSSVC